MRQRLALTLLLAIAQTVSAQNLSDLRIRMRQALEHERAGNVEAAADLYRALVEDHPGRADLSYKLADAYKRMGRYDEALATLDARIKRAPTDARARIHRADVLISIGRKDEALLTIDEALQKARSPGLFISVADTYRKQGLDDLAERAYRAARVAFGDSTLFQREIAEVSLARGDHLTAVREYARFATAKPQYLALVERQLRDIATEADDPEAIATLLSDRLRNRPDANQVRLYVTFALASNRAQSAIHVLTSLPDKAPVTGSLLTLGRESLKRGAFPIAAAAFDSLQKRTSNDGILTQAQLGRAQALEGLGADGQAADVYRSVAQASTRTRLGEEAAYRWARLLTRAELADSARHVLERLILTARHGTWRAPALFDLVDLHVAAERYPDAERTLTTIVREERGKEGAATAHYKRAEIDFMCLQFDAAAKGLQSVLGGTRSYGAVNDAIALSHVLEVGSEQDSIGLRALALGLRAERAGEVEKALAILKKGVTSRSALSDHNLTRQIDLLRQVQRPFEVIQVCEKLVEEYPWSPFSPRALLIAGDVYREQPGQMGSAVSAYERLLIQYGQSIEADEARVRLKALQPAEILGGQPG